MRTYIRFLGSGALTLVGLGATILVQGGWQAAAAGFAILQGLVFALTVIGMRVGAERPRSRRPDWAMGEGTPRTVQATDSEPARAGVPGARTGRPRRSSRALGHA
jgi:hypothetical protein